MKQKKIIKIAFPLLIVLCLVPMLLLTGIKKLSYGANNSQIASIIGPMIIPDLDGGIGDGNLPSADYSNSNLKVDTPYENGALRSYSSLGIYNYRRDETDGLLKYLSFVRYFQVVRADGRVIYDDDGILDTYSLSNLGDEVVDYKAYLRATCTVLPHDNGGFFWTERQGRFKDATIELREWKKYSSSDIASIEKKISTNIPNNPTNQIINLGYFYDENQKTYNNSDLATIYFDGTCYWENTFWGGTGDNFELMCSLNEGWFRIQSRNWNNNLTSSKNSSSYQGCVSYYSPKEFEVIATNLNNYIKVDDVKATSKYGTSVVPFKDGHHITISNSGKTKVEIENGAENVYTTYYCFIDSDVPDVVFRGSNTNNNRVVGNITTNADGSKSQTINEGIFKDQVQIVFDYNPDNEAPESATYTLNGNTYPLSSGQWLNEEGNYVVTVTDLAGNTTTSRFVIDKNRPFYNLSRLLNDTSYKLSKWYLVSIPYGYSNYGSYSFGNIDLALNFAFESEKNNYVTNYELNNIDDFTATNLVANGNVVSIGKYWYYKSKDAPNLYVYYFDENSLNEAISYYSQTFVSEQVFKINSSLNPNNYGNKIDNSVYSNIVENGYLANNFIFRQIDTNESYKIYYNYQEVNNSSWVEFDYNTKFSDFVNSNGLYQIKEIDFVGHETYYYVYVDLQSPMLDIQAVNYGQNKIIKKSISINDIPNNNELIFYYEKFSITKVIEKDNQWTLEVKCPDNTTKRYTNYDELPEFDEFGSGEFLITIADRTNTPFKFKVCLLGKAPQARFENINNNSQLKVTIITGENYNTIRDIRIFRNDICLNSELGYDEYPNSNEDELIFITPTTLRYIFSRGGLYTVEITDNFGRTITYNYKFEKELPTGILTGVEHNGFTKDQVMFIYDNSKYFTITNKNNQTYEPEETIDNKITTLIFRPEEETEYYYTILLVDKNDTENYNSYYFTIKTIKPKIYLYGVEPNGKTGGEVYATWDSEENYISTLINNGLNKEYRNGEIIFAEGYYEINLTDEIGNTSSVFFEIDKKIDFEIIDINNNKHNIEEIEYINFDVKIIALEPLGIKVTKDNSLIDYNFGLYFTSEGIYSVKLFDEFGNTVFFKFTIDKTPPEAHLYGVENYGITKGAVWISASESGLTSWLVKNENEVINYTLGKEIQHSGKYKAFVSDKANNTVNFEFEKDNEIQFDINIYKGGISNGGVRIIAYENLRIVMYKDNNPIEYEFEQILNEDGEYSFTLYDDLNNKLSYYFSIITKKQKSLKHILQENISITGIEKDSEVYDFQVNENELYLFDEGFYKVNIFDGNTEKNYSFEITLDTTPPTLELIGVENGGKTSKLVILKNVSEKPYELYITVDGVNFEYTLGNEIEKCGRFEVKLYDEAGNLTIYTFERIYALNGPSIAVLAGLGVLVILIIILLVKSRKNYYQVEETEEVIEEDNEETTIDEENDNDSEENN